MGGGVQEAEHEKQSEQTRVFIRESVEGYQHWTCLGPTGHFVYTAMCSYMADSCFWLLFRSQQIILLFMS